MNARILELIKNPDIIQIQDLDLLNVELKNHPYLQSIRALQLIGNHQFNSDNYQKELSITAAYTTDKKILYQLINKKSFESSAAENTTLENVVIKASENIQSLEKTAEKEEVEVAPVEIEDVQFEPKEIAKPVFVEGVLNRILFEGEEDFLERETEDIDIESTLESGKLVTRKAEKKVDIEEQKEIIPEPKNEAEEIVEIPKNESFSVETIINEDKIEEQKEVVEDSSEISFHATEEFLPEVKVNSTKTEEIEEIAENESVMAETIINEEKIEEQKEIIEDPSEISFHATEEFLPEVKIISNKIEETEKPIDNESVIAETIINEDKIEEEKEVVEDPSEISFHGSEEFLPEVKIKPTITEQPKFEAPKPQLSKQEEEMQRLIAEVEAKMKASKKSVSKESEPVENADINFSSTQEFKIEPIKTEEETAEKSAVEQKESARIIEEPKKEITEEKTQEKTADVTEVSPPQNTSWKPMSIDVSTPDSLIDKKPVENKVVINETKKLDISSASETTKAEERPVFNVSFFTPNVSSIESKKVDVEEDIAVSKNEVSEESNVPVFINTWQNWLKIERKEPVAEKISKEELKNTVIEKFIEKEPKISKLKDESDFVVKERGSNISHLMTETLANLYVEQKLYAKAIKAYEVLIGKHPQKKELFNEKIQEIKDLRKNS